MTQIINFIPYKIIANANEITHIGKNQIFKLTNSKLSLIFNHESNLEILGTVHLKGNKNATNFKISFFNKIKDFDETSISLIEINELNTKHLQKYLTRDNTLLPKKIIKDLNIKYLRLNNFEKNNFLNKVSNLNLTKQKLMDLKKYIYIKI